MNRPHHQDHEMGVSRRKTRSRGILDQLGVRVKHMDGNTGTLQ